VQRAAVFVVLYDMELTETHHSLDEYLIVTDVNCSKLIQNRSLNYKTEYAVNRAAR
jgi:hypothetical protein